MTDTPHERSASHSILKQPVAVWALAFACAVSFMGIGLVDPILPAISRELDASPTQTMLLFTSYLLITALAMFFSAFISSRIGVKTTLLIGLALIVVFAALSGAAGSVDAIIGFRAGWGLGNALFISTALAAIVGAAAGHAGQAVILYEAAIGVHGVSDKFGHETAQTEEATIAMARVASGFGVPPRIIGQMVATHAHEIAWLTPDDLRAMGAIMTDRPRRHAPPPTSPDDRWLAGLGNQPEDAATRSQAADQPAHEAAGRSGQHVLPRQGR